MAERLYFPPGTRGSATPSAALLTPQIRMQVYGSNGVFGPSYELDPTKSLIAVTLTKSLSQPFGTAQIVMTSGVTFNGSRTSWLYLLMPMDLVVIQMSRSGEDFRTVFVGYVDSVAENANVANPTQTQRQITVQASDLAVGLSEANVFLTPQTLVILSQSLSSAPGQVAGAVAAGLGGGQVSVAQSAGQASVSSWLALYQNLLLANEAASSALGPGAWLAAWLGELSTNQSPLQQFDPSHVLSAIVTGLLPILFQPRSSFGGYRYGDFLQQAFCDSSELPYAAFNQTPLDGSLYSTCKSVTNPPFYEFFGDLRETVAEADGTVPADDLYRPYGPAMIYESVTPSGNGLVWSKAHGEQFFLAFRKTPFSPENWNSLVRWNIDTADVVAYQIGRSRQQVVNFFVAYPESWNQALATSSNGSALVNMIAPAVADLDSIMQYGLSPMRAELYGFPGFDGSASAPDMSVFEPWAMELYNWYKQNPTLFEGQLTVAGDPKYRIGQRFLLTGANEPFQFEGYIETVQHQFVLFQSYQTVITFSRGTLQPGSQFTPTPATQLQAVVGTAPSSTASGGESGTGTPPP